jgi:hypothetical protein
VSSVADAVHHSVLSSATGTAIPISSSAGVQLEGVQEVQLKVVAPF